jgi:hypothetical protein
VATMSLPTKKKTSSERRYSVSIGRYPHVWDELPKIGVSELAFLRKFDHSGSHIVVVSIDDAHA